MKQAKILTRAEYKRVMAVIDAHRHAVRNRTMFALSFYAGLRACEMATLKAGDVFDEGVAMCGTRCTWTANRRRAAKTSKSSSASSCRRN